MTWTIANGRWLALTLLVGLAAGCEDRTRPLDGGMPIVFKGSEEAVKEDPCWRREKGGWHLSMGHCEPTTSTATFEGVWVTAFEESSFFPGRKEKPDPRDPARFTIDIELDDEAVLRRAGARPGSAGWGEAVFLRFSGRRTRDPLSVDCYGSPYFVFIVDRLIEARHLGAMDPLPPRWFEEMARNRPEPTVRQVHGGRWGELEAQAVEHCRGSGESDQSDGQARPPGNKSAE
jgi:hypothetical protein